MASRELIKKHTEKFPEPQPCDAVKFAVQESFGAAHFDGSEEKAKALIEEEFALFEEDPSVFVCEGTGDYLRLELKNPMVRDLGAGIIASMFCLSAEEDKSSGKDPKRLAALRELLEETLALFQGSKDCTALCEKVLKSYERGEYVSVSHSRSYKEAYKPSYRVISKKYLRLIPVIHSALMESKQKDTVVIAIDGPCAGGKTTAAKILSRILDAQVISMDDFFLPFERKTPERLAAPGGNIDYERFSAEILPFIRNKEGFTYRVFNCSDGGYTEKTVKSSKFIIVEGVYSMRPNFRDSWDLKVFFDVSEETQHSRLKERNPSLYERFVNEWIPMEEKYFEKTDVKAACDFILSES